MIALTEYIANRERLGTLSLLITLGLLLLIFLITQIMGFMPLQEEEVLKKPMEVKELVKLRFDKQKRIVPKQKFKGITRQKTPPKKSVQPRKTPKASPKPVDVSSLVKDFNAKKFINHKATARRTVTRQQVTPKSGISTQVARPTRGITDNSLKTPFRSRPSRRPSGRKAVAGAIAGTSVEVGAVSTNIGRVTSISAGGVGSRRGSRATRGFASGAGAAQISLPVGTGGGSDAAIDLHALIKWMKEHPGPIPKLVAHEMGHQRGDLSSAVTFRYNGVQYTIFLSCNENELLLRVCLVEGNDFILLKDSGISEESHFLTIGDVVRQGGKIQSLISSRKAPGDQANKFYSIFWSWWESVQK